jgi:RNA polymerase sigma-70 factor (ECF subfamily)
MRSYMDSEKTLIEQAKKGDETAMERLVKDNKQKLYYLTYDLKGNRDEAEDLAQDVFLKAFRSLQSFRGESKFSTWLAKIAVNLYIDQNRKKSLSFFRDSSEPNEEVISNNPLLGLSTNPNPEKTTKNKQIAQHISAALSKVTPRERSAFVLRHYQQFSVAEIGEAMSISQGTVKSLVFRAIQKLQKELSFYLPKEELEDA